MENFWENVIKYPKFFVLSVAGLITTILNPILALTKKGFLNQLLAFGFLILSCLILKNTLSLMFDI